MNHIHFEHLPNTPFSPGTYVVIHYGKLPVDGFVLSQVKIVPGWPNPVLECARNDNAPPPWLNIIDSLAFSKDRPEFNMGVYQVDGVNYPAVVYGTLEAWRAPESQQTKFKERLQSIPDEFRHLAHIF